MKRQDLVQLILDHDKDVRRPKVERRVDWLAPNVVTGMLRVGDVVLVLLSGLAAFVFRFGTLEIDTFTTYSLAIGALVSLNAFQFAGLYQFQHLTQLAEQARRLLLAWPLVLGLLLLLGFAAGLLDTVSRGWVALWLLTGFVALFGLRCLTRMQLLRWARAGRLTRNIAVIGAGEHGRRFIEHLRRQQRHVNIIGLFDDRRDRIPDYIAGYPVLGTIDDLLVFARQHRIDQVVVALPWGAEERLLGWLKKLKSLPADIRLCPDVIGFHLPHRGVSHIGGVPLLNVFEKPIAGWDGIVKSIEDRVLACLILLLVSPLMLSIALGVKLSSPGPVFFRQKRYGFNNEIIEVFKFRSMYTDHAQAGLGTVEQARRTDPRITPFGAILRRTSLDELPQFLNVLRGEMSIVGPRPHAVAHNEQYAQLIDEYLARHRVKPGITGWAQVNGLRGETETLEKMERRVQFDLHYIENWSLALDLRIILMTLLVGFSHPNAY
ncbi:MAG: undecaprenyl-phosphate glucose phosphotransferase [Geminicoccaceae bacterium]